MADWTTGAVTVETRRGNEAVTAGGRAGAGARTETVLEDVTLAMAAEALGAAGRTEGFRTAPRTAELISRVTARVPSLVSAALAVGGSVERCGELLAVGGVESAADTAGVVVVVVVVMVVGTFDGAAESALETGWHTADDVGANAARGEEEASPQPAAFALPAATHHSATAPSTTATAQTVTDGEPPREERMPVSHVTIPLDC